MRNGASRAASPGSMALRADNERGDGDACKPLAAADPTHPFVRFALDAHPVDDNVKRLGDRFAHRRAVRRNPRVLGDDRDIDLLGAEPGVVDPRDRGPEHRDRVGATVGGILIGEHLANVAGADGSEDGVGHRVGDRVPVGMAVKMDVGRNVHPAEYERATGRESVRVVPYADAQAISE